MDVSFISAAELGQALSRGEITSESIVATLLARIGAYDKKLNAFVAVYGDDAMSAAKESDRRRSRGEAKGPLDGVPFAVKDMFDVAGHPTSAGSRALPATKAVRSAHAVERLTAQGMILIGKTHTVEFAYGAWGTNPSCGTPVNPRDRLVPRVPGGSSSGSAVAVAAGLVPVALGTDTGGSVRSPAAMCGVIGLKTSVGLIGRGGVQPLAFIFDNVGPITRTIEDAALLLAALQGEDIDDPTTYSVPAVDTVVDLNEGVEGLTFRHPPLAVLDFSEEGILRQFKKSLTDLKAMGAIIDEKPLPQTLETYANLSANFTTAEAWTRYRHLIEKEDSVVDPEIGKRMSRGGAMTLEGYLGYMDQRRQMQIEFHQYLAGADALLIPTSPITAKPIEGIHDTPAPFGPFVRLANLLDLAAISIPMGDVEGLPSALQIVVRRLAEPMALRIARAFEVQRGGLFVAPSGFESVNGASR